MTDRHRCLYLAQFVQEQALFSAFCDFFSRQESDALSSLPEPALVALGVLALFGSAAAFRLQTGDAVYSWRTLSRFVVPGETVHFSVADSGAPCGWAVSAGDLIDVDENSVDWVAPDEPGDYLMAVSCGEEVKRVNLFVMVPYDSLENGALRGYRIGRYRSSSPFPNFTRPRGFVEVTPDNINTRISPRYKLAEFVSRQPGGFPKYLVLREEILVKLELLTDLAQSKGYEFEKFTIISGYRPPAYQHRYGAGRNSAHTYGGAADVLIDSNRDGMMDDLNHDGSFTSGDAKLLAALVDEFEQKYPELVGGCGWYRRTRVRGPFVHIDVRGERMRWHQ